jgi:hypothetical protein
MIFINKELDLDQIYMIFIPEDLDLSIFGMSDLPVNPQSRLPIARAETNETRDSVPRLCSGQNDDATDVRTVCSPLLRAKAPI